MKLSEGVATSNHFIAAPALSATDSSIIVYDSQSDTTFVVRKEEQNETVYFRQKSQILQELTSATPEKIEFRFEDRISKLANGAVDSQSLLQKLRAEKELINSPIFKILSQNEVYKEQIQSFLENCEKLGYPNNVSLSSIGYYDENPPFFWFAMNGSEIIAMAGIHRIEIQGKMYTRGYHRSCILPQYCGPGIGTLSRRIENSVLFSHFLKPQLNWMTARGYEGLHITTNNELNASIPPKSGLARSHKILNKLRAGGFAEQIEKNVFLRGVHQSLWRLNLVSFNKSRIECGHERLF